MKRSFLLLVALLTLISSRVWAQEIPENEGVYFLYNEESGLFLSRGDDWGSHAVATPVALPWKVSVADGKYTLYMYDIAYGDKNPKGFDQYCYTDKTETVKFTPSGNAATGFSLMYDGKYITCPASIGLVNFTTTASKWQFLTPEQYDDKMIDLVTAQKKALIEQTLMDATPKNFDKVLGKDGVTTNKTDFEIPTSGTWKTATVTNRADDPKWYESSVEFRTGCSFSRTISGLAEGLYKVRVRAMKRIGEAAKCVDMAPVSIMSDAYLLANGNAVQINDWYSNYDGGGKPAEAKDVVDIWLINAENYTSEVYCYVGADGRLDLKVVAEAFGTDCWFVFGGVEYTRYSGYPQAVSEDLANALLATVPVGKMNADVQTALNTAKNNLQSTRSVDNYHALQTAIENANASIAVYTQIAGVNAKVDGLDAAGKAAYAATLSAYNNGTLTDYATAQTAYLNAVLSQTTPGSDMTAVIVNPDFETDQLSGWTNDGFQWQDNHPYGSDNRFNRFAEKWVKGGSSLPDASISQSITLLKDGVYSITADAIACQQSYTVDQQGVYLYIGNNKTHVSTANNTPVNFDVKAHLNAGTHTFGYKTESTNCNWAAVDNFKLTYFGEYVAVTSVTINGKSEILLGKDISLTADVLPNNASFPQVTWNGDNDEVATIDAKTGEITTHNSGTVHFTATADGVISATYTVNVVFNTPAPASYQTDLADIEDEEFIYLKNVANGKYLGGANIWGSQLSLIDHGYGFTAAKVSDGVYTLDSHTYNPNNRAAEHYIGNYGYLDAPAANITFTSLGDGKFSMSLGENKIFTSDDGNIVTTNAADSDSPYSQWYIQTTSDRYREFADADPGNPADATFMLKDANFSRHNYDKEIEPAWTLKGYGTDDACANCNISGGDNDKDSGNNCADSWRSSNGFDVYQILKVPNGRYMISAQAAFREYTVTGEDLPVVYANAETSEFKEMNEDDKFDKELKVMSKSFTAGKYYIDRFTVNVTGGTLRIGVKCPRNNVWAVWDNFEIQCLETADDSKADMTVTDAKYATFCAPFDVKIPDGVTASKVTGAEGALLTLQAVETTKIPANTPVVLQSETPVNQIFVGHPETGTPTAGLLTGVYTNTSAPVGSYVLQNLDDKVSFYRVEAGKQPKVKAFRAYLTVNSDAKEFVLDEATGIATLDSRLMTHDSAIYNLAGQKVGADYKGIVIIGGKKYLNK